MRSSPFFTGNVNNGVIGNIYLILICENRQPDDKPVVRHER